MIGPGTFRMLVAASALLLPGIHGCGQARGAEGAPSPDTGRLEVAPALEPCRVERIVDGDTVVCEGMGRIRLLLIDAPEADQEPFGALATEYLESILPPGSAASLEMDVAPRDRFGRILAYIHFPEGRIMNEQILRAGFAVVSVHPPNVKHVERFREASREAMEARRGLWAVDAFECLPAMHRAGRCPEVSPEGGL